jgi:hypothetical protein
VDRDVRRIRLLIAAPVGIQAGVLLLLSVDRKSVV